MYSHYRRFLFVSLLLISLIPSQGWTCFCDWPDAPAPTPARQAQESDLGVPAEEELLRTLGLPQGKIFSHFSEEFLALQKKLRTSAPLISLAHLQPVIRSPGKSGSLFIQTQDQQFLLKTIEKHEFKTFHHLGKRYFEYLGSHPHTTLVSILGVYEIKSPGFHFYLALMPNLLRNVQDHRQIQVYDLKGRTPKKTPKRYKYIDDNLLDPSQVVLSDLYREAIHQDVEFLSQFHIMDYSLLIVQEDVHGKPTLRAVNIIDYLTPYSFKKKVAFYMKRIRWDKDQISTNPPDLFSNRFLKMVDRITEEAAPTPQSEL